MKRLELRKRPKVHFRRFSCPHTFGKACGVAVEPVILDGKIQHGGKGFLDRAKHGRRKGLAVRLQYVEALQREAFTSRPEMKDATTDEILAAYVDLMNETRSGNITPEQAAKENSILVGLLKAVETSKLKEQLDEIKQMLAARG